MAFVALWSATLSDESNPYIVRASFFPERTDHRSMAMLELADFNVRTISVILIMCILPGENREKEREKEKAKRVSNENTDSTRLGLRGGNRIPGSREAAPISAH